MINHKENCIVINGKQAIKMPFAAEKVMFQIYHRQLPAQFTIYADFESITERVSGSTLTIHVLKPIKRIQIAVMHIKLYVVMMINSPNRYRAIEEQMLSTNSFKRMPHEARYCRNVVKNKFNKPLKTTYNDEICFQISDAYHICCKKIFSIG